MVDDNLIRIGGEQFGIASEIDDPSGLAWPALQLMDGTRTRLEIERELGRIVPDVSAADVSEIVSALIESGHIEDAQQRPPTGLTTGEAERYKRSAAYFSWIDTVPRASSFELQLRLKKSAIAVLGVGGAGSYLSVALAAAGVGRIHCVDFDRVELSNLNRQIIYDESDIGGLKSEAAVSRLRRLNSTIEITGENLEVSTSQQLDSLMRERDLFVLCADKPSSHQMLMWANEAAIRCGVAWLTCGYAGPVVSLALFVPGETPCYLCFFEAHSPVGSGDDETLSDENAVFAPTAALAGGLGALASSYFLMGLESGVKGRWFHQNLLALDHTYYIDAIRNPACRACGHLL